MTSRDGGYDGRQWVLRESQRHKHRGAARLRTFEGVEPMGRGRAKAKQVKVARQLKYNSGGTDLDPYAAYDDDEDTTDEAGGEEDEDEDDWSRP